MKSISKKIYVNSVYSKLKLTNLMKKYIKHIFTNSFFFMFCILLVPTAITVKFIELNI